MLAYSKDGKVRQLNTTPININKKQKKEKKIIKQKKEEIIKPKQEIIKDEPKIIKEENIQEENH